MSFYAVVEFPEEEGATAVVLSSWLSSNNKHCYWPNTGPNCKLHKLAETHAKIDKRWPIYPCRVLQTYGSFESARKGCAKSEYTSNIDTSANETTPRNVNRKRKRRPVVTTAPLKKKKRAVLPVPAVKFTASSESSESEFDEAIPHSPCPTASLLQTPIYLNQGSPYLELVKQEDSIGLVTETATFVPRSGFSHTSDTPTLLWV